MMQGIDAAFPEKFDILFQPKRYKVLYGGRGGAKSWGIGRALVLLAATKTLRILCVRELQNSISESVHKLLSDQIEALGLSHVYEIQKQVIINKVTGSTFNFEGIRNNVAKIKSYEGIDIVWAEEAALMSKNSWDVLIPTVRKAGSEIWISFNPENEDDETYKRFVIRKAPDSVVVKMTWRDNPWFPEVLRMEMEACKASNYDDYLWIWEGNCRQTLDAAIYKEEVRAVLTEERVCHVPYVRGVPVDVTLDLGKSHYTSLWFRQSVALERRYLKFHQAQGKEVEYFVQVIKNSGYVIGTITLPHDAKHVRLGMKFSIEQQIRQAFPANTVKVLPRTKIHEGILAVRRIFPYCYFDAENTVDGWKALRNYNWEVIAGTTRFSDKPAQDEFTDAADAFRYDALARPGMGDFGPQEAQQEARKKSATAWWNEALVGSTGWMGRL